VYKVLGKKVSAYPGIAKPEGQKRDGFSGIIIVALKEEEGKIKHYKKILKGASGNQGRREADAMRKLISPQYIVVTRHGWMGGPEKIMEKGDKKLIEAFIGQSKRQNHL